jgi:hypothetical protein
MGAFVIELADGTMRPARKARRFGPGRVKFTSREAYYEHVLSGRATSQKDRIMRYIMARGESVSRNEVDRFFDPPNHPKALDGGTRIPWRSSSGAIAGLVCKADDTLYRTMLAKNGVAIDRVVGGCDHKTCGAYLRIDAIAPERQGGVRKVEFLVPIGDRWAQRRFA